METDSINLWGDCVQCDTDTQKINHLANIFIIGCLKHFQRNVLNKKMKDWSFIALETHLLLIY